MFQLAACLLWCVTTAPAFQNPLDKDVYLIYSRMLANPRTSHGPDNNERYLIADRTAPPHPAEPCIVPPKERQKEFREVLSDYLHRKGEPRELPPFSRFPSRTSCSILKQ
jgi:hypothetical protein